MLATEERSGALYEKLLEMELHRAAMGVVDVQ
jgi:hypothetical protein